MSDLAPDSPPSRNWLGILLIFLGIVVFAASICLWSVASFLHTSGNLPPLALEVIIQPNMPFVDLAHDLESKGIVKNAKYFVLYARYKAQTLKIRSGRFLMNTGWTPPEVLKHLINDPPIMSRVTLPEGLTWWETGKRLEAAGMVRFSDFEKVIHDPTFLQYWGIPQANAEGFLFPDTYLIMRPLEFNEASARTVVGRLIDTFWRRTASLWPEGKRPGREHADLVRNLVCLASIVEKETGVPNERKRVAGVYTNRLQRGMRLQADPTVVYGIGPSFTGSILRSQLNDAKNPYNTYQNNGLPPGPICSPGLACLTAASMPEQHPFLYFVATGTGGHIFSSNLQDHNKAVTAYRQRQQSDTAETTLTPQ